MQQKNIDAHKELRHPLAGADADKGYSICPSLLLKVSQIWVLEICRCSVCVSRLLSYGYKYAYETYNKTYPSYLWVYVIFKYK